jgi:hypothetical protein
LDKSIKYLIDHKWIAFIGTREVMTKSRGIQSVNEYEISDLWKMNVDYYESQRPIAHGAIPRKQPIARTEPTYSTDDSRPIAHGATKEEQDNKNLIKKREIATSSLTPKEVSSRFFSEEDNQEQESVISMLLEGGMSEQVACAEIKKFVMYWTELNSTGKKQRWEMEKTFEIKRRLSTWFQKVNQFNGFEKKTNKITSIL